MVDRSHFPSDQGGNGIDLGHPPMSLPVRFSIRGDNLKIVFEFIGGPYDGKILHGVLGEPSDAERYFLFSNRAAIGYRFRVLSEYAVETLADEQLKEEKRHQFQQHHYLVVNRFEDEDEVRVLAKYENP